MGRDWKVCGGIGDRLERVSKFGGGFMKFWRNEKGQGLTEYALIIALVAIVAVAALTLLGGQISGIFGDVSNELGGA